MRRYASRGFTLIELLVVIAIIGILASIVLVSLNSSRTKGRDITRVAALKEMVKAIGLADSDPQKPLTGCTGVSGNDASTCTGPSPVNFFTYKDPKTPGSVCVSAAQGTPSNASCQYMIAARAGTGAPSTQNYEICAYLETASIAGFTTAGFYRVDSSLPGTIQQGCN